MKINANYSLISNKPQQNPNFNGHVINGKLVGRLYLPEKHEIAGVFGDFMAEAVERKIPSLVDQTDNVDVLVFPEDGVGFYICILQKAQRSIANTTAAIKEAIQQIATAKSEAYLIETVKSPERLYAQILSAKIKYDRLTRPPAKATIRIANPCLAPKPRPDTAVTRRVSSRRNP